MSTQQLSVDGAKYHIEVDGNGPPLLLLHGFTGSSQNWEPLVPTFAEQYTVVRVDLLGHGQTDAPTNPQRYSMHHAATALQKIMANLRYPSYHLLGYSMGGRLALYTAAQYADTVQTLTLESASPGLATADERAERMQRDDVLANRVEDEGISAFVDFWENIPLFSSQASVTEADRQRLRDQRLTNCPTGLANSLRGMGTGAQPSQWQSLPDLTMPVLLITGTLDTKFTRIADEMAEHIPNVQRAAITGAGHTVHFEQPIAYSQTVLEFLDAHR